MGMEISSHTFVFPYPLIQSFMGTHTNTLPSAISYNLFWTKVLFEEPSGCLKNCLWNGFLKVIGSSSTPLFRFTLSIAWIIVPEPEIAVTLELSCNG